MAGGEGVAPGDKNKNTLMWCRWIAKRPKTVFALTLSVHVSFLVITGALFGTGYNILPIVFDTLPLDIYSEEMFLREEAWSNRDSDLDGDGIIQLDKRSADDKGRTIQTRNTEIVIDVRKMRLNVVNTAERLVNTVLQGGSKEDLFENVKFEEREDSPFVNMYRSVNHCCKPSMGLPVLSKQNCECNPHSDMFRYKRDVFEMEGAHEREYFLSSLTLIYMDPEGENILTKEHLRSIMELESAIYDREDFKHGYCRLMNVFGAMHCQPFTSPLRLFDGSFSFDNEDLFDPSFVDIDKVLYSAYTDIQTEDFMMYFMSRDSVIDHEKQTLRTPMTRSVMYFGYPLKAYGNDTDSRREQENEFTDWAKETIVPEFMEYFYEGIFGMDFNFMCQDLYWKEAMAQVFVDWYLIFGAFFFIFIFMWFQTGSLFITGFGVFSILTSFVGSNIIFTCIIGYEYFGYFNVLAVFIILGIGADDIFIFADTWKIHMRRDYDSLEERLTAVFKRAASAMFVTSLTTMVAFFVNSFSQLLPISAFGTFSGLTIFVNYISVISFFPAVVVVHHIHFENKGCLCCCEKTESRVDDGEMGATKGETKEKVSSLLRSDSRSLSNRINTAVSAFFGGKFFRFVTHAKVRWVILAIFVALLAAGCYGCSTITLSNSSFRLFSPKHPFEVARDRVQFDFLSTPEDPPIEVTVVWGLDLHDMSMCDKLKYDEFQPCDGKTVWDEEFDINDPDGQVALLDFCNELRYLEGDQKDELRIGKSQWDESVNDVYCFIYNMSQFYKEESQRPNYPAGLDLDIPITLEKAQNIVKYNPLIFKNDSHEYITQPFDVALQFWLTHRYTNETVPDKRGDFRDMIGTLELEESRNLAWENAERDIFRDTDDWVYPEIRQHLIRYIAISVTTDAGSRQTQLTEGLRLLDKWEAFIKEKIAEFPEPLQRGWQYAYLWTWLRVIESLAIQSVMACGIGVGLAFVVIFIGTTNIITGLVSTILLGSVTVCSICIIPMAGWKFGLLEALNLCLVVGLAVDYIVHIAEGYHMASGETRLAKVQDALENVGISVLSGAITTLGASFFMMFAKILFFQQFGSFIFLTIGLSMLFSLFVFMAAYSIFGPEGYKGSYLKCCKDRSLYKSQTNDANASTARLDGLDFNSRSNSQVDGMENNGFSPDKEVDKADGNNHSTDL